MKIMLVGGSGFIGSSFKMLYDYQYVNIDYKKSYDNTFKLDIVNDDLTSSFSRDIDVVVFLADNRNSDNTYDYYYDNINGVFNILKNVKNFKVKHIIYLSTSHVYGNGLNFNETNIPNPLTLYSKSKLCCENIIKDFCTENNIIYQILRVTSVNGSIITDYKSKSLCSDYHLISKLAKGYFDEIKTEIVNPNIVRDYIHIKDLCEAINLCINSEKTGTYNVGSGVPTSSFILANMFRNHTGYNGAMFKNNTIQMLNNTVDNNEFIRMFGFNPQYKLNDIIKDTLNYFRMFSN